MQFSLCLQPPHPHWDSRCCHRGRCHSLPRVSYCLLFSVWEGRVCLASLFGKIFCSYFFPSECGVPPWSFYFGSGNGLFLDQPLPSVHFSLVPFYRLRFSSNLVKPFLPDFYLPGTSNNFYSVNGNVQWFLELHV